MNFELMWNGCETNMEWMWNQYGMDVKTIWKWNGSGWNFTLPVVVVLLGHDGHVVNVLLGHVGHVVVARGLPEPVWLPS